MAGVFFRRHSGLGGPSGRRMETESYAQQGYRYTRAPQEQAQAQEQQEQCILEADQS